MPRQQAMQILQNGLQILHMRWMPSALKQHRNIMTMNSRIFLEKGKHKGLHSLYTFQIMKYLSIL